MDHHARTIRASSLLSPSDGYHHICFPIPGSIAKGNVSAAFIVGEYQLYVYISILVDSNMSCATGTVGYDYRLKSARYKETAIIGISDGEFRR
jgi:hypothetical protein